MKTSVILISAFLVSFVLISYSSYRIVGSDKGVDVQKTISEYNTLERQARLLFDPVSYSNGPEVIQSNNSIVDAHKAQIIRWENFIETTDYEPVNSAVYSSIAIIYYRMGIKSRDLELVNKSVAAYKESLRLEGPEISGGYDNFKYAKRVNLELALRLQAELEKEARENQNKQNQNKSKVSADTAVQLGMDDDKESADSEELDNLPVIDISVNP